MLRLATWNCARGPLQRKLDALAAIAPHVAVITEAPRPASESKSLRWFGDGRYGILVNTVSPYSFEPLPQADLPPCVVGLERVCVPAPFALS